MDVPMAESGELVPESKIDKTAFDLLRKSRTSVEEIVAKMLSAKKEGRAKSEIRELVTQMLLNFVTLRQANRSILLEEESVKAETERAKAPLDSMTLQLQNMVYEKNHYVKAIKACKSFKSNTPDVELVPETEFIRDAPEDIKNSIISNGNAQNLMLKRLNYEQFQRKELCKLQEKLEKQKKFLQESIGSRKKFLSGLPSQLKSLKKASLPVEQQLGILHTKKLKQQSAESLPRPLYVIYSQLLAQKEVFGENIDLDIVGSLRDAQALASQPANKDDHAAAKEGDDGLRKRKRPNRVLDKENIYQAHPLKIVLHVHDDEASESTYAKLTTLNFEYLMKLNVVCVGVEGSGEGPENNILCNLFPGDTGLDLPHQSAKLRMGHGLVFDGTRISHPYKWAQHLAGIEFLPEVSPLLTGADISSGESGKQSVVVMSGMSVFRQQNRVQTVVQRIRARIKAQLVLA